MISIQKIIGIKVPKIKSNLNNKNKMIKKIQ